MSSSSSARVITQSGPSLSIREVADRYLAAWAARDTDAIIAMHSDDSIFWRHTGEEKVVGRDAIRQYFQAIFVRNPTYAFDVHRILFGEQHWVLDWTMKGEFADRAGKPVSVRIDMVDIVTINDRGEVTRKDTFLDGVQAQAQMAKLA
jgi:steroid delta-isomerase-like uncharacterized protein